MGLFRTVLQVLRRDTWLPLLLLVDSVIMRTVCNIAMRVLPTASNFFLISHCVADRMLKSKN